MLMTNGMRVHEQSLIFVPHSHARIKFPVSSWIEFLAASNQITKATFDLSQKLFQSLTATSDCQIMLQSNAWKY